MVIYSKLKTGILNFGYSKLGDGFDISETRCSVSDPVLNEQLTLTSV